MISFGKLRVPFEWRIEIYDTGDGRTWCFEVFKGDALKGSACEFMSRDAAEDAAHKFIRWSRLS